MTASDLNKLSVFHTKSLRRILRIFWPKTISNGHLPDRCRQDIMETIIKRRRWRCIGHVLRKEPGDITHSAIHWTPEGKRKRGRPKNTWRRTAERDEDPKPHLGHQPEAGPEQTGVAEDLRYCP